MWLHIAYSKQKEPCSTRVLAVVSTTTIPRVPHQCRHRIPQAVQLRPAGVRVLVCPKLLQKDPKGLASLPKCMHPLLCRLQAWRHNLRQKHIGARHAVLAFLLAVRVWAMTHHPQRITWRGVRCHIRFGHGLKLQPRNCHPFTRQVRRARR